MKTYFFKIFLLASLCLVQISSRSEDIDLFSAAGSSGSNSPNLILIIDNFSNFSSSASGTSCIIDGTPTALDGTTGGIEQCALYNVINGLTISAIATVNIGVMAFSDTAMLDINNVACSSNIGGCLLYPLTGLTSTSKPALLAWIKSWQTNGANKPGYIKANGHATGAAMQEAWAYLAGRTGISGRNYSTIAPPVGCGGGNYVVFVGNAYSTTGFPKDDTTGSAGPKSALIGSNSTPLMNASPAATAGQTALITTSVQTELATSCGQLASVPDASSHESSGYYADEWARYMLSQSITTYTVGLIGDKCKAEYAWLLKSMATSGNGAYFPASNYSDLLTAFNSILAKVQATNSAFAAVSLPVSTNTQGSYTNQVFLGMFRPDPTSLPRWAGNLKQYKLGYLNNNLSLLDADDKSAYSSSTGFIDACARSFWTPALTSPDAYWSSYVNANCAGYAASSNSPDGNLVEKGAQGYKLRSMTPSARFIQTCSSTLASCTTLTNFDNVNVSATNLEVATSAERDTLINWARGQNVKSPNDEVASVAATAMRPSVHGDVVHSRPVAINFGTDTAPKVVVFYGGNDGMLRAINGNRTAAIGTVAAGDEMWSFVPPEFYSKIKRSYNNTPSISASNPKSYGMDGTVTGYRDTSSANGDAWIYATMRRGGRALYAFKVDGSTLAITLMWKRGCDSTACTNNTTAGDFTGIGQTWAAPKIIKAGYSASTPLLVMGGGYDMACEDAATCTTTTTGNRIYVMNASTGNLLKTFATDRGVVGDVTFIRDASGNVVYGYAADMGGNLFRLSGITANVPIGSTVPASWIMTKIASLGCSTAGTCTSPPNRKFIFGPDVVVEGDTNILLIGSGDREKPLNTANATSNYFFMVRDKPTVVTYLSDELGNCNGSPLLCLASLLPITVGTTPDTTALAAKKGWYLALLANEQVVTSAATVFGQVSFSTHEPVPVAANSCSANLGRTRVYNINYSNGSNPNGTLNSPFQIFTNLGLPPSPSIYRVKLDNGTIVPVLFEGIKPKIVSGAAGAPNSRKIRSYWYIQK